MSEHTDDCITKSTTMFTESGLDKLWLRSNDVAS